MTHVSSMTSSATFRSSASAKSISTVQAGREAKDEAIKKRANEEVMPLLLNKLAHTAKMRGAPTPEEAPVGPRPCIGQSEDEESFPGSNVNQAPLALQCVEARKEIGMEANKFDLSYARV